MKYLAGFVVAVLLLMRPVWSPAQTAPLLRGNLGIHDPSTIIKCKDRYYMFGTGQGIVSRSSSDKVFWTTGPNVFSRAPSWTTNTVPKFDGTFWAPDIIYLNGQYCLYYAVSSWGSQISAIGLATNPTLDPSDPNYLWTDRGRVIQSSVGSAFNTIDPSLVLDAAGNPWVAFGSYWNGIYIVQLDPSTGLRLSSTSPVTRLAYNGSIEAACVFRRGGYYYLFVNWGSCCSGVNSTYHIRVGRSTRINGPYLDRNGIDLAANGGTMFLEGTGKFTGPGHVGILSQGGEQFFSYHYYDAGAWASWYNAFGIADFDLEPLSWTSDDWPVFTNDWAAVYDFNADARDRNGQYYGLLQGASVVADPVRGHVLTLSGTNQYVWLPAGVAYARTFSAVVKWNGGSPWQRIFDFGNDTGSYVMLTPSSGTGKLRSDIRVSGTTLTIEGPAALPVGVWTHVALTLDGQTAILYVNGSPVATRAPFTLSPLQVRAQTNHLGRSKFVDDPDFNGQLASFKAYGRVLSAAELVAPAPLIAAPTEDFRYSPGSAIPFNGSARDFMEVPLGGGALTWRVEYVRDRQTNVVFGPVSGITNGIFSVPASETRGGIYYFVLQATDGLGRRATARSAVHPAHASSSASSYYPLRTDADDAHDRYDGSLHGGASFQSDPERGNVLNLSGAGQFMSLPPGAAAFKTFSAWVKWNGGGAWQRIFDFGNDTTHYAVLTPSAANGKLRFNVSVNGIPGEQIIDAPAPLPAGLWTHVAVVLDGQSGVLYTNGVAVATNSTLNLVPKNLNSTNNWIGKSQFAADPYFNGRLSSVRLFSRALAPSEITAPVPVIDGPGQEATFRPGDLIHFSGHASDIYDAPLPASALTWAVQFRYPGVTNTIFGPLSGITNGSFAIPPAGLAASNGFYRVMLRAADSHGRAATNFVDLFPPPAPADWASFYPFNSGAQDASNRFHGYLYSGAAVQSDSSRGNVVELPGTSSFIGFPSGVGGMQTFSGWVNWRGGAPWQRIFDFGQGTARFVFLTPSDSSGRMQAAITSESAAFTHVIRAQRPLAANSWTHLAVVFDGRQGILYSNGLPIAVNNSVNLLPSDVAATQCYLGRSQFPADAYFNGRLDSIRLNSRPLALAELLAPLPLIVQPAPGSRYIGGDLISFSGIACDFADMPLPPAALTWSAQYFEDGRVTPVLGPLSGATNGTLGISTTGPLTTNVFYRLNLSVTDSRGNQGSASLDLLPVLSPIELSTIPPGLQLNLEGQSLTTPASFLTPAGLVHTLAAPVSQTLGDMNFGFVLWSDGKPASHEIRVPVSGATWTASYVEPVLDWTFSGDELRLAWPDWARPMELYTTTNLAPPTTWTLVTNLAALPTDSFFLPLTTNGISFYRLQLQVP